MSIKEKDLVHVYFRKETGSYYLHYTIEGKRHRKKVGRSRKEAELLKNELELKVRKSEHIFTPTSATLKGFAEAYLKYSASTKAATTVAGYQQKVRLFLDQCVKLKPTQVKPADINKFMMSRLEEVEPATVASDIRTLQTWFNWGKANGYVAENPCEKVQKIRNIKKNPPKYISLEQVKQLLHTSKTNPLYPLIATAIYAGLRRKELINLEWGDIDFKKNTLTVKNKDDFHTKSYKFRVIPLSDKLKTILLVYRKKNGYCFLAPHGAKQINSLGKSFELICKSAGIENCTLHVLRHTFASQLVMAGVSIYKVSQWLGHADVKTTMIYAHLSPQDDDINRI